VSLGVGRYSRNLGGFKFNVHNKAAPEGCIAEGYIATKLMTFCSRYLDNAPTFYNKIQRNPDGSKGAGTRVILDRIILTQIHRYITKNSDEFLSSGRELCYINMYVQLCYSLKVNNNATNL
jgi:hypothetical protein